MIWARVRSGPDIRPGVGNRHLILGHTRSYIVTEGHRRSFPNNRLTFFVNGDRSVGAGVDLEDFNIGPSHKSNSLSSFSLDLGT